MSRVLVQVSLLSGRYHAHPWGEAQYAMAGPEWPPSPWRLLRGLAARWFDANPHPITDFRRDDLLSALGRAGPPVMWLPPVSFAEVPYYQPLKEHSNRRLHFDHFAVLSEGDEGACFCFEYELNLSNSQRSDLAMLMARMTYFGRSESRAHLSLVEAPPQNLTRVVVASDHDSPAYFRRRVLVARDPFTGPDLWAATHGGGHLVQRMIKRGRRRPPNTEWIDYAVPRKLIRSSLDLRRPTRPREHPHVTAVQYGMFRRVPIGLPELVRVAREIRDHVVRRFEAATGEQSRRLTGREADDSVATGHRHAFWLPEPYEGTGSLHRCTVWLPDGANGIDPRELDALLGVQRILASDDYPILVIPEHVIKESPELNPSRYWQSLTPFLASRNSRQGRRIVSPADELQRMVEESTGARPHVTWRSGPGSLGRLTRVRTHNYAPGQWRWTKRAAAWFDLEFERPVVIPRPFGADAHFGLGRFVPRRS